MLGANCSPLQEPQKFVVLLLNDFSNPQLFFTSFRNSEEDS